MDMNKSYRNVHFVSGGDGVSTAGYQTEMLRREKEEMPYEDRRAMS